MTFKIYGGNPLRGATVKANDLRAGIALVLAGLVADGETLLKMLGKLKGVMKFERKIKTTDKLINLI